MNKRNTLIFLTSNYPFGFGEAFIEGEMPFLAAAFDQIHLISNDMQNEQTREVQPNVALYRFPYELTAKEKLKALLQVTNPLFWKELMQLKYYGLQQTKPILSTILFSLYKGKKLRKFLAKLIKDKAIVPEEAIAYSYWSNDMAVSLAMMKADFPQLKMVSRGHGWDVYLERSQLSYLPFRSLISDHMDQVFAISENGKEYIRSKWMSTNKATILCSKLGTFDRKSTKLDKKQKSLFQIASCSNVIPLKRVGLIAQSISLLETVKVQWTHFGKGSELDNVKSYANALFADKEFISFEMPGAIPNTELLEWYDHQRPDIFVNVSQYEGLPVSIMEAMSFGIPVIGTDVGGTSEIIRHKVNGWLLTSDPSAEEVSTAINYFIGLEDSEYLSYSANALKTWGQEYNAESNYKGFVKLLKS